MLLFWSSLQNMYKHAFYIQLSHIHVQQIENTGTEEILFLYTNQSEKLVKALVVLN